MTIFREHEKNYIWFISSFHTLNRINFTSFMIFWCFGQVKEGLCFLYFRWALYLNWNCNLHNFFQISSCSLILVKFFTYWLIYFVFRRSSIKWSCISWVTFCFIQFIIINCFKSSKLDTSRLLIHSKNNNLA